MEKKVLLGIRKKKPIKRKKNFLKKVAHFLKYDAYMFAPLVSSSIKNMGSADRGLEIKEPIKGNGKRLIRKFGEYLNSDSYMYAPLVALKETSCSPKEVKEPVKDEKKLLGKVAGNMNCDSHMYAPVVVPKVITSPKAQVLDGDRPHKGRKLETRHDANQTSEQRETVKHMVYQFCHSSSMSGRRMSETRLRKLTVE